MKRFNLDYKGRKTLSLAALAGWLLASSFSVYAQEIIPLYASPVPNTKPSDIKETGVETGLLKGITKPTLEYYKPAPDKASGAAVIVIAGGGYGVVVYQGEGVNTAKALAEKGVAAFVLKYRLPNDAIMADRKSARYRMPSRLLNWFAKGPPNGVSTPAKSASWAFQREGIWLLQRLRISRKRMSRMPVTPACVPIFRS